MVQVMEGVINLKNKILFFGILSIVVMISMYLVLTKKDKIMNQKLRIGYEYNGNPSKLDPARIVDIAQSNLIENIYSRIIDYDINNNIVCVLCEKFWVENDKLFIKFKDSILTSKGDNLGALDARATLQRLLELDNNTHGNLKNYIDHKNGDSILVEDNVLIIKLLSSHFSQFLIPLLATMDFSILPIKAIEHFKKYGVLDFTNTSGPYSVLNVVEKGAITLKANENHPLFEKDMFSTIEVIPVVYGEGIDDFLAGKIDVLDVTYYPGLPQYENLFNQKVKKFNTHKTSLINLLLLNFSSDSAKTLSPEQKFNAAKIIADTTLSFKKYGYGLEQVFEFFQANGTGHLSS